MKVASAPGNRLADKAHRLAQVNKIADSNARATAKEVLLEELAEEDDAIRSGTLHKLLATRADSAARRLAARSRNIACEMPRVVIADSDKHRPSHIHETVVEPPSELDLAIVLTAKLEHLCARYQAALLRGDHANATKLYDQFQRLLYPSKPTYSSSSSYSDSDDDDSSSSQSPEVPRKPTPAAPRVVPVGVPVEVPVEVPIKTPARVYDRSAITARAHIIKTTEKVTWSEALKRAWAEVRK